MENISLFADSLQNFMVERNIVVEDIHKATKLSTQAIHGWLRKVNSPTLKSLIILSDYFKCSLEYLTGRTDKNYFSSPPPQVHLFAERFRSLLKKNKITIKKFNKETNIARSQVSYFLNGSVEPLLESLVKIAKYFDCTLDYLAGREN